MKSGPLTIMWDIGRNSLDALPDQEVPRGATLETFEREQARLKERYSACCPLTLNDDTIHKLRRIAETFTRKEIEAHDQRVKREGSHFGPTHLIRLLAVDDQQLLRKMLKEAITKSWSVKELKEKIQARRGSRRSGVGRRPNVPEDPQEFRMALARQIETWLRWTTTYPDRVPQPLKPHVEYANFAVQKLREQLEPSG